jgi:hypothetical protein
MREDSEAAFNYIRFLTDRVRFLNKKIDGLVAEGAVASLRHYLLQNAAASGDRRIVRPAGSLSALAEQLNIARASLYRAVRRARARGLHPKKRQGNRNRRPGRAGTDRSGGSSMKKIVSLLLTAVFVFALAACAATAPETPSQTPSQPSGSASPSASAPRSKRRRQSRR